MPSANAPVSRFTVAAHSVFELDRLAGGFSVLLHLFDQVSNDLGVGFGNKLVPLRGELALQFQIIFNNAVVNDDDAARAVAVTTCGCMGLCDEGPMMVVYPEGVWYRRVQPSDVPEIVSKHLVDGRPWASPWIGSCGRRRRDEGHVDRAWGKFPSGDGCPRESRNAARSPE